MSEKILVPALGESITEATVAKWLKSVGDNIEADEPIVELETDKVNLEVPSPVKGFLGSINAKNGQVVEVGSVLGSVNAGINESAKTEPVQKEINPEEEQNKVVNLKVEKVVEPKIFDEKKENKIDKEEPLILTEEIKKETVPTKQELKEKLSPSVRKMVAENDINIDDVKGSGKDGRILKGDLI